VGLVREDRPLPIAHLFAAWSQAAAQASLRASASGDFAMAEILRTAAAVLNNLSLGV
jgi:hypothetical protein